MRLDMDLQKAKKLKNASLQDIIFVFTVLAGNSYL